MNLFWDQLLQLVAEGHVVPVVGRDLLTVRYKDQEVLLYPLIAQLLAERLEVSGADLPEGGEINTIVCRYIEKGNRIEDIYTALKIVMPPDEELSIPEPLVKLAAISHFKLFVTTTFDSMLERAINKVRFAGEPKTRVFTYNPTDVKDLPAPLEQLDRPATFHLFGKLSAMPEYAVTQEDTLEFLHSLQSKNRQPDVLFDELNSKNLLILGCCFGDWLARFFIRTTKRQRLLDARGSTDYVADARISGDDNLVFFLRHFSAHTKIYEAGGALEFIDELHRRWTERHPFEEPESVSKPGTISAPGEMKSGVVFLSYASEDRMAVVKIKDALEAEGVDVFFDKDDLRAGDDFEEKLKRCISQCSLFVPVISKNTMTEERRFFRIEWNQALEEALKVAPLVTFIVPVVIDDTQPTAPTVPEKLRKLQWEQLPDGQTAPGFVIMIKDLYRKYQKFVLGTV